jgi:glucose-6-phosphate 1-dehydrogenase
MELYHIEKPFNLVIFGASGDLAKQKIFPALYSLMEQKRLPKEFKIIGFARTKKNDKEFQKEFEENVKKSNKEKINTKLLKELIKHISYFQGQYTKLEDFKKFKETLKIKTTLAYFSVPPIVFKDIIENLGKTKLPSDDIRLIIEKPFGKDCESATELYHFVSRYFEESEVFLLDHYLGKAGVQSILNLRHSNRLLNLMMKGPEIANIQITGFEKTGVKTRANYFDEVGTIKDMIQSHLFQILALITMSIPITEDEESIHREKYNILSALKFNHSKQNITIGQYKSYQKEKDVPKSSQTETFAALRLFIDRESWFKKPIYLRTGKRLNKKHSYVVIEIKKFAFQPKEEAPNLLIIELQPNENIRIKLINKNGPSGQYQDVTTSESIACSGDFCLPEHALLLLDVFRKKRINFLSFPEIIASWKITDQILKFLKKNKVKLEKYEDGGEGPASQNNITKVDGFKWHEIN